MNFLGCQLAPVLIRETFLLIPLTRGLPEESNKTKDSLYPCTLIPPLQWLGGTSGALQELRGTGKKNLGESSVMFSRHVFRPRMPIWLLDPGPEKGGCIITYLTRLESFIVCWYR